MANHISLAWLFVALPLVVALLFGLVVAFADCATQRKGDRRG